MDVAGSRNVRTSGAGTTALRWARTMGPKKKEKKEEERRRKKHCSTSVISHSYGARISKTKIVVC